MINTETKIIRRSVSEYEELEQEVNEFIVDKRMISVQYEVAGGYMFAFILYLH